VFESSCWGPGWILFFFQKKIRFSLINIRLGLRKVFYTCGKIGDTLPKHHYVFCSRTRSLNRPRGKLSVGIHVIFATSFISLRILHVLDVFLHLVEFFLLS